MNKIKTMLIPVFENRNKLFVVKVHWQFSFHKIIFCVHKPEWKSSSLIRDLYRVSNYKTGFTVLCDKSGYKTISKAIKEAKKELRKYVKKHSVKKLHTLIKNIKWINK